MIISHVCIIATVVFTFVGKFCRLHVFNFGLRLVSKLLSNPQEKVVSRSTHYTSIVSVHKEWTKMGLDSLLLKAQ